MALNYVEDIFNICHPHVYDRAFKTGFKRENGEWFVNFATNIYMKVVRPGKPLTTEQGKKALDLLHAIKPFLIARNLATADEIDRLLRNPVYRSHPTPSANVPREVRYVGGNRLAFRYKWNDVIKQRLQALSAKMLTFDEKPEWDWTKKVTTVPVTSQNVSDVETIIAEFRFHFDDEVAACIAEAFNQVTADNVIACVDDRIEVYAPNCLLARWCERVLSAEEIGNRLYSLPRRPGTARLLSRLPDVLTRIVVDPGVLRLAQDDLVEGLDGNDHQAAIQRLVDFDLRGIVAIRDDRGAALSSVGTAARAAGIEYIVLPDVAPSSVAPLMGYRTEDVRYLRKHDDEVSKIRDKSLLVLSEDDVRHMMFDSSHSIWEFPHTIMLSGGAALNFEMFSDFTTRNTLFTLDRAYMSGGEFTTVLSAPFSFMFNTVSI